MEKNIKIFHHSFVLNLPDTYGTINAKNDRTLCDLYLSGPDAYNLK